MSVQQPTLRVYQLVSDIISSEILDNGIYREVLNEAQAILCCDTIGLYTWDEEIGIYYPILQQGPEQTKLDASFRNWQSGKNQPPCVYNTIARNEPILLTKDGFVAFYCAQQCLGMLGFSSAEKFSPAQIKDFLPALAQILLGVQVRRDKQATKQRTVELTLMRDRLQQVLSNNMEKQALIETMAADLKMEAEKATRASSAKADFLSTMSHELRTPLNAIIGFAQILEMEDLSEEHKDSLAHISNGGRHLLGLINQMLDLTKIESGKIDIQKEWIKLPTLAQECIATIRPLSEESQITVVNAIGASTFPDVYSDPFRLKQILLNLLSNAIKYNHPQGQIIVEIEPATSEWIRVKVSDTGMGLSPIQQSTVFEAFERLHYNRTSVEGAGIGLNICRLLIQSLGGKIGVTSTVDVGSCFWIDLPLSEGAHDGSAETS